MDANDSATPEPTPVPIAFCITDLDAGGAERTLVQIVTRLNRRRWSPHVFCLSSEGVLVAALREAGVPVTCFGARRWWNVGVVFRLARHLKRFKPAILQTFLYHANLIGRCAGRIAHVPHIVSGIRVAERRSRYRLWLDRITQRWVDKHVCVSRGVAEFSIQVGKLDANKVTVIPNGVDFARFANAKPADLSEFAIPVNHKTVLCVGRLDPQKGTMILLEAFTQFARERGDVHVLFVGSGPLEDDLRAFVTTQALQEKVHLAGQRDDVPQIMRASDCLVLASLWEGMPNVVLEAMAAGLPIICTAVEGTAELLRHGDNALLVPVGDAAALRQALENLFDDPGLGTALSKKSQHKVNKWLTWDSVADDYASFYEKFCPKAVFPARSSTA